MSNMPDINTKRITVTLHIQLFAKIRAYAEEHKLSINDTVRLICAREMENVNLTAADYEWIAAQVKENEEKRKEAANA